MSFAEDPYRSKSKKKSAINAYLPALGLVLALALAGVAYVLSEPAHTFLMEQIEDFPPDQTVQYVVAGVIWVVLILFSAMIYAAAAPKPPKIVSEAQLKQERVDKEKERIAAKKRKRAAQAKMAEERKKAGK